MRHVPMYIARTLFGLMMLSMLVSHFGAANALAVLR